jgi:hypothetical protein
MCCNRKSLGKAVLSGRTWYVVKFFDVEDVSHVSWMMQQHTFRKPAKPLEPPTPRTSVLGLDRLAKEKRAAKTNAEDEGSRKKQRLDDDAVFKGVPSRGWNRKLTHFFRSA